MRKYRLVAKKGEGTFSEVLKAQNVKDGRYHAIKCMKNRFDSIDQVNNLREIQALRRLSPHEHVITLEEVLYDQPTGRLALVFELMDANLYELIKGRRHYLNPNLIKSYIWQLMKSLDHMHKKGIFHRDIKPENILIESSTEVGKGLKLADFGSCRGIYSKQPYTEYISTRWYRAPECLLTDGYYGPEMDLWGAGCVMFEITSLYPLFPGANEVDQISRIHKVLGTPSSEMLAKFKSKGASHISFDFQPIKGAGGVPPLVPHAGEDSIDLMVKLLKYDASERITAREAMRHPYFKDVRESEAAKLAAGAASIAAATTSDTSKSYLSSTGGGGGNNNNASSNSVAGVSNNKPLPSITNNGGYDSQQQKQQQLLKPLAVSTVGGASGTLGGAASSTLGGGSSTAMVSSLPPIVSMGAGGTQFSKFAANNNSNNNMMANSLKGNSLIGGIGTTNNSNGSQNAGNSSGNNNYNTSQKRRGNKKNKINNSSQQQLQQPQQQQQQPSQQQRLQRLSGATAVSSGPTTAAALLDGMSITAGNNSSSTNAAQITSSGAYGHPNRHYLSKK